MPLLYVLALADRAVEPWTDGDDFIESIPIRGVYAVCVRRSQAVDLSEAALRRQLSIVRRIADSAPAVLPARFGSLVERAELTAIVRQRESVILDSLAVVRGNTQMTVRVANPVGARPAGRRKPMTAESASEQSGRAYLERRRIESLPDVPTHVEAALERVKHLIVAERRSAAAGVSLYHLVRRADSERYRKGLMKVSDVTVSGPWPPFAFAPELWS